MMLDLARILWEYLNNYWAEANPSLTTVAWRLDEYDPKNVCQVCIENLPAKQTLVSLGIYRVEHKIRITVGLKLIRNDAVTIENTKTTFTNMKSEIDRIFNEHMFDIVNTEIIHLSQWDDGETVRRGFSQKGKNEVNIVYKSIQLIVGWYYLPQTYYPHNSGFTYALNSSSSILSIFKGLIPRWR